jgi:Fic family protein
VEEVPRLVADVYAAVNDDLLPAVVQAALVHAQFETIHPFDDGNGRTGRALIHVILRRRGVAPAYVPPISVILAAARNRYIVGPTRYRADGVVEWIAEFAAAATHSANLAARHLGKVEALTTEWRQKLTAASDPRADAAAWEIIDMLPAHPVITAPVAAAGVKRTKAAVYEALRQLNEAGVLISLSESKRNQSWKAAGLLDLLEELEAGVEQGFPQ